jgi:hypothetical protein
MYARPLSAFTVAITLGAGLLALTHCEVLVNLDRGEVDAGPPDGCPICTNVSEGGKDAAEDGELLDGGDASAHDGGGDGAPTDSPAGGARAF